MGWLVRISVILIVVVGLVVGVLLLLPGDKIASLAADQIKAQTGRDVDFGKDVKVTLWPVLGVETGTVTVGNADWASDAPMLTADALSIGVAAAPLLSGEVQIKRVIAQNPVLRLEEAKGRKNWDFSTSPSAGGGASSGTAVVSAPDAFGVTLERLELRNARLIHVKDGQRDLDFAGVTLKARWPEPTAPLDVEASLAIGADSIDVAMTLPDLPGFAAGRVTDMNFTLTAPETTISYTGKVSSAGEIAGQAKLSAKDTARMLAAFGQPGVRLPKGLGQAAEVASQITYTQDGKLALRGLTANLDQNTFSGNADLLVADPPQVTARLSTGTLDLTELSGGSGAGAGREAVAGPSSGWSKAPIDASGLALANGSIRLTAQAIKTTTLNLGPSDLTLELDRSRGVLKLAPVSIFGGTVTGQLVANNRNGLSVGGKLQMDGIEAQDAMVTFADIDRLSGKLNGNFEFLGVGQTEDAILRSLSGKGALQMGRGVISGIDLDGLMGSGSGSGGATVFNSLTASYTIQNGNLDNRDLLLQLDNYRADGTGRVGLGARDIDYLFTPIALRANAGQGLSIPVRIVGPWADPAIKPDLSQVIEAAAGVEIDKIEQEAKDRALEKLGQELDTTVTEDQNIEELIKDRLEDEAKKGVLKLFGLD
ncbi:putative assembly protein [Falsiruegeria litorea R37]|uniref:Putative assembly protein n=1 Tax=Falsiruegeria litorea R37 TaxID=1200284 RepID=A0A1Y5RZK7_9RHOB|nr:AsmA family protein [Falsiruegeria litorea]SLN29033.1 putative assembly protein [Falsiruegeria litorea R37]